MHWTSIENLLKIYRHSIGNPSNIKWKPSPNVTRIPVTSIASLARSLRSPTSCARRRLSFFIDLLIDVGSLGVSFPLHVAPFGLRFGSTFDLLGLHLASSELLDGRRPADWDGRSGQADKSAILPTQQGARTVKRVYALHRASAPP